MSWLVPALLLVGMLWAVYKKVPPYDAFVEGAERGLKSAVRVAPFLVAVMVGVALVRASGLMEALEGCLDPVMSFLGLPRGVTALFLIRPLSGSAALAEVRGVYEAFGADSFEGLTASVMMGSTETVFYTIGVYMSAAGVKQTRYAIPVSLIACCAGAIASGWLARLVLVLMG